MLTKLKQWLKCFKRRQDITVARRVKTKGVTTTKGKIAAAPVTIVPRAQHNISRADINPNALKVLYRLKQARYEAYLVGGGVRDLLLGKQPKDFDIATNALPEEVKKLFRNCRLIGRRFRLAHIYFGNDIIEVATFRSAHESNAKSQQGMLLRDNVYGTLAEDVLRRDFTINAIYYNIRDFSLVDYVGGLADINHGQLRIIGNASERYREDPVRMLRAMRFASKLDLQLHPATAAPINQLAGLLTEVAPARLFEEYLKLFLTGKVYTTFCLLQQYGLLAVMLPTLPAVLENQLTRQFIKTALLNAEERLAADKPISPVFLLAVLLWQPFLQQLQQPKPTDMTMQQFQQTVIARLMTVQKQIMLIPKNCIGLIQDIWLLQTKLAKLSAGNVMRCYKAASFRLAYDFLLLRAQAGDTTVVQLATWWQEFVLATDNKQRVMLKKLAKPSRRR